LLLPPQAVKEAKDIHNAPIINVFFKKILLKVYFISVQSCFVKNKDFIHG